MVLKGAGLISPMTFVEALLSGREEERRRKVHQDGRITGPSCEESQAFQQHPVGCVLRGCRRSQET